MKKKVLQVLGGIGYGGAEAFVMNQFRNLQNEYTFDFAVQVHLDEEKSYEREIKELGGNVYYTGLFRSSPIEYANGIKRIIQENGSYDAVHIHVNEQCGFAALGARKAGARRVIVHAHSSQYGQRNMMIRYAMLIMNKYLVHKKADKIVACSSEAAKMYFGKTGEKTAVVLKNPINIERFFNTPSMEVCRQKLGVRHDLVVCHIGRFIDVKNHQFIVDIGEKMKAKDIDFEFLFVGGGILRTQIEREVIEKNLSDRIRFLGERTDIPEILAASDVLILPSKYEGLPTVLLEAQASGTPCIASSTVSKESDIGIGLVQFEDISSDDSDIVWMNRILAHPEKIRGYDKIKNAFDERNITIEKVSVILRQLYG